MFHGITRRTLLLTAVLAAVWAGASFVRADVIAVEGKPMAVGVTVLELKEGSLSYKLSSGREVDRPIEQVKYLQITGWDDFNAAEKLRQAGNWRGTAAAYEKILAAPANASGKLDRALLLRCRLVAAYDEEGMFDKAVAMYLDVLDRMPTVVTALRPKKVPAAGSTFLPTAASAVDAFVAARRGTPVGVAVAGWRLTWPDVRGSGAVVTRSPAELAAKRNRETLAQVEGMVAAGRFDDALARLEPMQTVKAGVLRPEVFYWQGRAWLGQSERTGSTDAERHARRAALAFMRVVIHYPAHALAAESLFRAGQSCRRAGRADLARNLWTELMQTHPADKVWVEPARREMAQASSAPATAPAVEKQ